MPAAVYHTRGNTDTAQRTHCGGPRVILNIGSAPGRVLLAREALALGSSWERGRAVHWTWNSDPHGMVFLSWGGDLGRNSGGVRLRVNIRLIADRGAPQTPMGRH